MRPAVWSIPRPSGYGKVVWGRGEKWVSRQEQLVVKIREGPGIWIGRCLVYARVGKVHYMLSKGIGPVANPDPHA